MNKEQPRDKLGRFDFKHESRPANIELGAPVSDGGGREDWNGRYAQMGWIGDYEPYLTQFACAWGGPDEWEDALKNGHYYEAARYGNPEWLAERGIPSLDPSYNDFRTLPKDPLPSEVLVALHNTPPHRIPDEYATHPNEKIRTFVAQQGNPHHLDILVNDRNSNVLIAVANTGSERHTKQLLKGTDPTVKTVAQRARTYHYYPGSYDERIYSIDWETRASAAADPQYMEYERLVRDPDPQVRKVVAERIARELHGNASDHPNFIDMMCDRNPDVVIAFGKGLPSNDPARHYLTMFHPEQKVRNAVRNSIAPTHTTSSPDKAPF